MFLTHKRQKSQSVEYYITELKVRAANCEYGVLQKWVIEDQLVLNVTNQSFQEKLISVFDLELDKAVTIIKLAENSRDLVRQMNHKVKKPIAMQGKADRSTNDSSERRQWKRRDLKSTVGSRWDTICAIGW